MSTIVTRAGKGSPLTNTEVDANFTNLNTDKLEINAALGTPASVTLTNATGLPISTGVSGLGTGVATALAVNVGSAGAPVVNGGALGTPASGTLTNATGLPTAGLVDNAVTNAKLRDSSALSVIGRGANSTGDPADIVAGTNHQVLRRDGSSLAFGAVDLSSNQAVTGTLPVNQGGTGITSFGSGVAAFLGTPSSANLAAAVTDETGTGALVFANSPTLVTPALGTPSALVGTNITGTAAGLTAGNVTTNANLTGAITSTGNATVLGSFTSANLAAALTDETGTGAAVFATSPTLVTPALGTPASGVVTNLTGTASININGTVGATTPAAGAFTTINASGAVTAANSAGASLNITSNQAPGSQAAPINLDLNFKGFINNTMARIRSWDESSSTGLGFLTFSTLDGVSLGERYRITQNGTSIWSVAGSEAMRLTSTGLGVGTTSPAAKLSVDGSAIFNESGADVDFRVEGGTDANLLFVDASTDRIGVGEAAPDYKLDVNGTFGFTPGASVTPADNGDVVFELTNNTTLTVKAKGSDGVVRSGTITLA